MVICPCSMGTLAAVAAGTSRSLVERAADVTLKERRKLVLVTREAPLSVIHLRNMVTVAEAGAVVLPASPGFYHRPTEVSQLVDFVVQRIIDQVGLDLEVAPRWGGTARMNPDDLRRLLSGAVLAFLPALRWAAATGTTIRPDPAPSRPRTSASRRRPDVPTASLEHGGLYRICFPATWNGDLVLFAHGYVAPQDDLAIPEESIGGQSGVRC